MRKTTSGARVAAVRKITRETAEEFADMIGKSVATLRSWESGRLPLGEDSALRISLETGCACEWLLFGSGEPVTAEHGEPFTIETYAAWRKLKKRGESPQECQIGIAAGVYVGDDFQTICAAVAAAERKGLRELALRRLGRFASQLRKEFLDHDEAPDAEAAAVIAKAAAAGMLGILQELTPQKQPSSRPGRKGPPKTKR